MGNEVVTVVDNSIIVAWLVIDVIIADVEVGQLTQVVAGLRGQGNQVATHLTEEDCTVGQILQFA